MTVERLVALDYFTLHSADANGPPSLHPDSPLRAGEVTVRKAQVERGVLFFRSRGLVRPVLSAYGLRYVADESAAVFLDALNTAYLARLRARAAWAFGRFGTLEETALEAEIRITLDRWRTESHGALALEFS